MNQLSNKAKIYILFLIIISALLIFYLFENYLVINIKLLAFFSILAIITESLLIPLSSGIAVSVGFAICLASIVISGPLAGAIVSAIGFTFRFPKIKGRGYVHLFNLPLYKTIINISQSIIVSGISGIAYIKTGGILNDDSFVLNLIPIIIMLCIYVLLNSIIVVKFLSILNKRSFIKAWFEYVKGVIPNTFAVGTLGVIIALAYIGYGTGAVLLFFGPLLLARYSFKLYVDTKQVYLETIQALTKTIEAKDSYTSGHASRVAEYSVKLAKALNLSDKKIENVKTAALLHDIGKIGIDDSILKKPEKLSVEEYAMIKKHPVIGAEILKDVDFLRKVVKIIKYHHERYDGKGYPDGLKGKEIPIEAYVLSLADVYDAMTTDRPYRPALTKVQALKEIEDNAGTQFEPRAAQAFVQLLKKEMREEMAVNVG